MTKNRNFQEILCGACLGLVILVTFTGYDWNWTFANDQEKAAQEQDKEKEQLGSTANEAGVSVKDARALSEEEIQELGIPRVPEVPEIPRPPKIATKPNVPKIRLPKVTQQPTRIANPNQVVNRQVSVPDVQSRLKEIIALNEDLKPRYKNQAAELQRVVSQAQIHQKILKQLQETKRMRAVTVPQDTAELVRQEKIRLISDETQSNYDYLSSLRESSES